MHQLTGTGKAGRMHGAGNQTSSTVVHVRSAGRTAVAVAPAGNTELPAEIAFLENKVCDRATLLKAAWLARRWRTSPEQVLIDTDVINATTYYQALAAHVGLNFRRLSESDVDWQAFAHRKGAAMTQANIVPLIPDGPGMHVAVAPRGRGLRTLLMLARRPDAARELAGHIHISPPRDVAHMLAFGRREQLAHNAAHGLRQTAPQFCAADGSSSRQKWAGLLGLSAICAGILAAPHATMLTVTLFLSLLFAAMALLRIDAALRSDSGGIAKKTPDAVNERDLPVYTVLVPLYREEAVLPRLVQALQRLDYPAAKLDIKLIFEADDTATLEAAKRLRPPANFDFVVVPPAGPRTKPKALNYALQFARGSLVTIYDAEDRPEPDQLKKAAIAFSTAGPQLACLQARLNFHNAEENWLTRQFAIEYAALFDGLLPALSAAGLPLPLGGTSNHFRRDALNAVGNWDPYNVTEDADLGMRLARLGYSCRTLASATFEEACASPWPWLRQRTRWLKGWMQTFVVHMRHPVALLRALGPRGFAVFQLLTVGTVATALCYPVFSALLIWTLWRGDMILPNANIVGQSMLVLGLFNLICGFGCAFALAAVGLRRRGMSRLIAAIAFMPVYWLGISVAAYRALWKFARDPFRWEKTEHRHMAFRLSGP